MKKKIILTDADGVLLDWEYAFDIYLQTHGFNKVEGGEFKYTSLSKDENAQELRKMNLQKLFGKTAFEKFIFLDTGADKDDVLKKYEGTGLWWIEDKIVNCEVGLNVGLKPLLMEHGHNMDFQNSNIPRVKNWKEIYERITGV